MIFIACLSYEHCYYCTIIDDSIYINVMHGNNNEDNMHECFDEI